MHEGNGSCFRFSSLYSLYINDHFIFIPVSLSIVFNRQMSQSEEICFKNNGYFLSI